MGWTGRVVEYRLLSVRNQLIGSVKDLSRDGKNLGFRSTIRDRELTFSELSLASDLILVHSPEAYECLLDSSHVLHVLKFALRSFAKTRNKLFTPSHA
jgi:hypothetical protein